MSDTIDELKVTDEHARLLSDPDEYAKKSGAESAENIQEKDLVKIYKGDQYV